MSRGQGSGARGQGYRDLKVWEKAMLLVEQVYALTASFPAHERFGLTSQLRRADVSVPSNIAEGYGRGGGECRFVDIAYGSLCEVETQLEHGSRLGFARPESLTTARELASEVGRMLNRAPQAPGVRCQRSGIRRQGAAGA